VAVGTGDGKLLLDGLEKLRLVDAQGTYRLEGLGTWRQGGLGTWRQGDWCIDSRNYKDTLKLPYNVNVD
jgi:hypothetical protein